MQPLHYFREVRNEFINAELPSSLATRNELELLASMQKIIKTGEEAVKFILPPSGKILDNDLAGMSTELKLPFPKIIIEWNSFKDKSSTKSLVIAEQLEDDSIAMYSLLYVNKEAAWATFPCMAIISNKSGPNYVKEEDPTFVYSKSDSNIKPLDIAIFNHYHVIPGMEHLVHKVEDWIKFATYGLSCEIQALLELLQALSCSNVKSELLKNTKPLTLKQKRCKSSLPLDQYRVLVIDTDNKKESNSTGKQKEGRSPREHLRRGHIRVYQSGLRIWIQSCVINPGTKGKILKEYLIK
jgi:hypothetical protein